MRTFHDDLKDMNGYSVLYNIPVQVCGTEDSPYGYREFTCLAEARKIFPSVDPYVNGKKFSWAMKDKVNGKDAMRFESWAAENMYSN
jgi:hypothetical protein